MKKYVLIAGVNGAGKSTLYQALDSLKAIKRINTDEIVRSVGDWRNPSDVMKDKCDLVVMYDNTTAFNRFAVYKNGKLYILAHETPEWFKKYVQQDKEEKAAESKIPAAIFNSQEIPA